MTEKIDKMRAELAGLSAKLARSEKVNSMLQDLQGEENALEERSRSLKAILSKEEADVDQLERTSATSILYSLLGNKEARMDKEKQEAYAARLKFEAVVRQLDDCRTRLEDLRREKRSLSGCGNQYDQVFASLRELLRQDPAYAERLCALERKRGETLCQLKELGEAIAAGEAVIRQIRSIEDSLGSAESWGTWDLFGGGLISDLAKHSHLDEAQAGTEQLQVLLGRFHTELADVHIGAALGNVNIDGFLRFADYFFDGLIADWSVLSRIQDAQERVYEVERQVDEALSRLGTLMAGRQAEKDSVEKQLAELVTFPA